MAQNPGSAKNLVYGISITVLSLFLVIVSAFLSSTVGSIILYGIFGAGALIGLLSLKDKAKGRGISVLGISLLALILLIIPATHSLIFGILTGAGIIGAVGGVGMAIYGYREYKALPGKE